MMSPTGIMVLVVVFLWSLAVGISAISDQGATLLLPIKASFGHAADEILYWDDIVGGNITTVGGHEHCSWRGIVCDNLTFNVVSLNLSYLNLGGEIPSSSGDLKNLQHLDIKGSKLSGQIPDEIGDCASLRYLSLQGNNIVMGQIPEVFVLVRALAVIVVLLGMCDLCTKSWRLPQKMAVNNNATLFSSLLVATPLLLLLLLAGGKLVTGAHQASPDHSLKANDKIESLPGQPSGDQINQYGGYIRVQNGTDAAIEYFYYFVEAVESSSTAPLLLWLNGGPGCSSMIGAMSEIGPFRVKSDGKTLFRNPYSWNEVANVLFLENAPGIGFSYAEDTPARNFMGDSETSEYSYMFLFRWLEKFPEFKGRDFYIAGESYAGYFIPQLVDRILHHRRGNYHDKWCCLDLNLVGIAMGNALLTDTTLPGKYENWFQHGLLSPYAIKILRRCHYDVNSEENGNDTRFCQDKVPIVTKGLGGDNLNSYNIYAPLCKRKGLTMVPIEAFIDVFDPCTENYTVAYMNLPEVQEALHANQTVKLHYPWGYCSQVLTWKWEEHQSNVLGLLKQQVTGVRVWLYSGDFDGMIPVITTMSYLKELGLAVKEPWKLWHAGGNTEIAGFTIGYEWNLTYATVRGAGHMVPSYKPREALELLKSFMRGEPLY